MGGQLSGSSFRCLQRVRWAWCWPQLDPLGGWLHSQSSCPGSSPQSLQGGRLFWEGGGLCRHLPLESRTGSFSLLEFSRMLKTLMLGGERPVLTPYTGADRSVHPCTLSSPSSSPSLLAGSPVCACPVLRCMLPHVCSGLIQTAPGPGDQCPPPTNSRLRAEN